jgi:hypothetical protein
VTSETKLPELPLPDYWLPGGYTADQMQSYARAAVEQAKPEGVEAVWFCDGPEGYFYHDDLGMARKLVNLIDPEGDDWTITNIANPFGTITLREK